MFYQVDGSSVRLKLKVQPKSSRSGLLGELGDQLRWGVHSPPEGDKANDELVKTVAEFFGLRKAQVEIVSGSDSRQKTITLVGISLEEVLGKLRRA